MENNQELKSNKSLPMVALRGLTILPGRVTHFDVSRSCSISAVERAMEEEQLLFVTAQKDAKMDHPDAEDLYAMGTLVSIKQVVKLTKGILRVIIAGEDRAKLVQIEVKEPYMRAEIKNVPRTPFQMDSEISREAMLRGIKEAFAEYGLSNPQIPREAVEGIEEIKELESAVDQIAASMQLPYTQLQELLETTDYTQLYELLTFMITKEIQVLNIKTEIQEKVKERVDKHQREYILREQLNLIREELGDDTTLTDADEFEAKTKELEATEEVKKRLLKEIKRFKSAMASPAENGVTRTYIETLLEMPWEHRVPEHNDLSYAKKILDEEHYGLEKVKERIQEYLAVRTLTHKGDAPILCLVGPPGTGKTSIGKSLAKALHKPYVRISLGGVRDEAEIRGHRKTYVGAMPGRIANAIKTAGVKNPLMLLDEIDKVSTDYKGDTFSALLEVLDSEQNNKFRDHYLELPLDLSEVLFVTTANSLQTIPGPLLDRMEVIEVHSYTENEKLHIAKEHLIPKQLEKHGLTDSMLSISKGAIWKIARNYTKEAGVRQLERKIGEICRKSAKEILETGKKKIRVTESNLDKYLGNEIYSYQMLNEKDEAGIVRGLAWTSVGGDTLQIEVNVMYGKGELTLTGQLGDVMKESAAAGISYIRSVSESYKIEKDFFETHDIHVHIPEGAVPKDGPSAGITMATAMLSAITGQKVRADVAMTGEITLRGRVLPIGGLKEKLLAAKHAGMKTVIVPNENKRDVEEISKEITKGLEIVYVTQMKEVLKVAFAKGKEK